MDQRYTKNSHIAPRSMKDQNRLVEGYRPDEDEVEGYRGWGWRRRRHRFRPPPPWAYNYGPFYNDNPFMWYYYPRGYW